MEHYTALVLWHEREREYPRLIWLPVSSSLLRAGLGLGFCRHIISLVSTILSSAAGAQLLVSQHCLNPTWWNHHHHSSRQNVDMTRQYVSSMPLMCSSNPGGDPSAAHCRPLLHINMWNAHSVSVREISTHSNRCFNNQQYLLVSFLFPFFTKNTFLEEHGRDKSLQYIISSNTF